ncbi:MAG TPA: hypothetical protein VIT67_04915 [Povalibacter sp.]
MGATRSPETGETADRALDLAANPAELNRREAANLKRAAKYVARAYEYLDRKPFDMRAADAATDQYDRAASVAVIEGAIDRGVSRSRTDRAE